MKKLFLIPLFMAILCQTGFAQEFDKVKLDNYFDALEANDKFMGSVAVSQGGEIIYSKSVGYSDLENSAKSDEESKYRIGSISKTFTAVLVLKAKEENKLDLSQTIDRYFPHIQNAEKITLNQLLYHRSGIHNFTDNQDFLEWNTEPKTEEEMVAIIAKADSDFEPGSQSQYSNSNYLLLTYILQQSFNKPYRELLEEYITKPIGLESTYLGAKINVKKKECKSYSYLGVWKVEPETDISIPMGAGGVVSTPTDLVKFSNALFAGKLLKKESLDLMKTIESSYGIGLFQIPFYGKIGYGHTGGIDGFRSAFIFFSEKNISYALLSNGLNYGIRGVSKVVLSAIYDKPFDIPEFSTYEVSSKDLDKYIGLYSSTQIPLKISISKENNTLIGQGTGQPSFPLEATEKNQF